MIVYYGTTGKIQNIIAASANTKAPANAGTPLYLDDADYADVWAHPSHYLIVNSTPVLQPYLTTTKTTSSYITMLTVILNNPPSTPPTNATLTIAGSTLTVDIANNQATFTVALHPTVAMLAIPATVSATGTVSESLNIGGTQTTPTIGLQLLPATSSAPALVAPMGSGSKAWGRAFYLSVSPQTQIEVLTEALQDLYGADSLALNTIFASNGILAALTSGTSPLMTLTADEQNAWTDIQTNILGSMPVTLANAYPSGGTRLPLYQSMVTMAPVFSEGALGYMQYLQTIPGLA